MLAKRRRLRTGVARGRKLALGLRGAPRPGRGGPSLPQAREGPQMPLPRLRDPGWIRPDARDDGPGAQRHAARPLWAAGR